MDFYWGTEFKVGKYDFNFRPDSDEEREAYEAQDIAKIGKGRTANIVRIDEDGTSYEQIINEGAFEGDHEDIVDDINERLSRKSNVPGILLGTIIPLIVIAILDLSGLVGGILPKNFTSDNTLQLIGHYFVSVLYAVWLFFLIRNGINGRKKRTVYLLYDISPEKEELIQNFYDKCLGLKESEKVWGITGERKLYDYKRNSGAESSVSRRNASIFYYTSPIKRLQTNVNIPILFMGGQSIYFFPDNILYGTEKWLNAISYEDLNITLSVSRFMEEDSIPSDAERVGVTWKYVNADGSPDRRFNDNRRIPILKYCEIKIEDDDDFCLTLHTSNFEIGKAFANALNRYKNQ
jgi:hypothetical protein